MTINPFDPKTVLLAKHAQQVVLIHFPIALFISAVGFDYLSRLSDVRTHNDPQPLRSKNRIASQARATRSADPLSDSAIHIGRGIRLSSLVEKESAARYRSLFQSIVSGDLHRASSGDRTSRLALGSRRRKVKRDSLNALTGRKPIKHLDLAGFLDPPPIKATARTRPAKLPPSNRSLRSINDRPNRPPRRIPKI